MWGSRIAVAAVTVAVLALGLAALFSTGRGTNPPTVEFVGVANPPGGLTAPQAEITIPNVIGESAAQASQAFFSLGFQVVDAATIAEPGETPGTVVEQMPGAGSMTTLDDTSVHLSIAQSATGSVRIIPRRTG